MFLHAYSEYSDQADLSLCWVHRSFCWLCHAVAHVISMSKDLDIESLI